MKNLRFYTPIKELIILVLLITLIHYEVKPQSDTSEFNKTDLVELIKLDSTFLLDIRYATDNNFLGKPVYKEGRAFLQRPAAEALVKVNEELKPFGYGLVIFDGYRPWSVTKLFWEITPEDKKEFVADPKNGSRHNRGCAVDVSMYELKSGKQVKMPSGYDEMSERSHSEYSGGKEKERRLRDLLKSKMETHGFKVLEVEWWHFDFEGWENYRVLDVPFEEI